MSEKPIIFSGEMIRAILEGRKTQARPIINPQPTTFASFGGKLIDTGAWDWRYRNQPHKCLGTTWDILLREMLAHCPYGQPGDRLWVRETWGIDPNDIMLGDDGKYSKNKSDRDFMAAKTIYRASWPDGYLTLHHGLDSGTPSKGEYHWGWHPSIFMPRWASRITLEIVSVRVERVQGSEEDAKAEGIKSVTFGLHDHGYEWSPLEDGTDTAKESFEHLWDSINGKRRGCAWADNPFVWVVAFKRLAEVNRNKVA